MLGWKIEKEGEYKVNIPILSEEEEEIIKEMEERFKDIARVREFSNANEVKKVMRSILDRIEEDFELIMEEEQKEYLSKIGRSHIFGFGAFEELIKDEELEEIAVIGVGKPVYVYSQKKGWLKTNIKIENIDFLINLINKMAESIGRRITLQNPRLDAIMRDGSRIHASIPPISEGELTIRKFKSKPLSPKKIVEFDTIEYKAMAYLSLIMQSDSSILISGNTASGKTTTLNSLFAFVPRKERVVIVEETPEINLLHEHKVRMSSDKEAGVELKDLVYDSLRMRPDRIIVGEIRNREEAEALVDVLLAGQARGAYATFHAKSSEEALRRLKSFGVNEYDLNSIDLLIVQRRIGLYERRKIKEVRKIVEISFVEKSKAKIGVMYERGKKRWVWNEDVMVKNTSLITGKSKEEVKKIVESREKSIKKLNEEFEEFFNNYQKEWFK